MKKNILRLLLLLPLSSLIMMGCNKEVDGRTDDIVPLQPANTDANAGDWRPILLTVPTEFSVAAPVAINTLEYTAQLNEIKT